MSIYSTVLPTKAGAIFPDLDKGKEVFFQGSRQMDSISRRYYEKELGAGMGPNPALDEMFGYTEPFRRMVQREDFAPQANEVPNDMPSWLPGDDYYTNFKGGDPYVRVEEGYARLPGAGYAALHPELKDVNPEDYPDIYKMSILGDVAPDSRQYNNVRQKLSGEIGDNTELRIEYEKILNRVRQTKNSGIRMDDQVPPSCRTKNLTRTRPGSCSPFPPPWPQPGPARPIAPPFPSRRTPSSRSACRYPGRHLRTPDLPLTPGRLGAVSQALRSASISPETRPKLPCSTPISGARNRSFFDFLVSVWNFVSKTRGNTCFPTKSDTEPTRLGVFT